MDNERAVEDWVRNNLGAKLTNKNDEEKEYWSFVQGSASDDRLIDSILRKCGGKPDESSLNDFVEIEGKRGKGKPEFIFRSKKNNTILIVECKFEIGKHQSKNLDKPSLYNLDGLLYYAKYFKEEFDVIGIAASGLEEKSKISFFNWKKGEKGFNLDDIKNHERIKLVDEYLHGDYKKIESSLDIESLRKSAENLHEIIYQGLGFTEKEKPLFITACLIALKNKDFRNEYLNKKNSRSLVLFCEASIKDEIKKVQASEFGGKYDDLKNNLIRVIENNDKLSSIEINKKNSFLEILKIIEKDVCSFISKGDVIGEFYHEFLKYSTGDGKNLGMVLTPSHIADLFCGIALKELGQEKFKEEDKVLDICCGTGSFLISALNNGIGRNNIYGSEVNSDVNNLALANMILWGDGKSHISRKDCFDEELSNFFRMAECNVAFLNPPYSQKKKKNNDGKSEIEFIEHACDLLKKGGVVIAIVPLSSAIGTKHKEERERIMKKHTLKATMTMPPELFSGNDAGVHTCIMVWKAWEKHNKGTTSTWLSNWKDDSFVILKGKRFDKNKKWEEKKKEWVSYYCEKNDKYNSVFKKIDYEDCWLADAWVETNYSELTENFFEKNIRDYLAFRVSILEEESIDFKKNE